MRLRVSLGRQGLCTQTLRHSKAPEREWQAQRTVSSGNSRGDMMTCECFRDAYRTEMVMRHPEFRIIRMALCGGLRLDQLMA